MAYLQNIDATSEEIKLFRSYFFHDINFVCERLWRKRRLAA